MSFAKRFNTPTANFDFEMKGKELPYCNAKQLADQNGLEAVYQVKMLYINKSGHYGDSPCIVTGGNIVNAPSHLIDSVKDIIIDPPSISLINAGYVGFRIYEYENKFGKQYSIEWVDIATPESHTDPEPFNIPF